MLNPEIIKLLVSADYQDRCFATTIIANVQDRTILEHFRKLLSENKKLASIGHAEKIFATTPGEISLGLSEIVHYVSIDDEGRVHIYNRGYLFFTEEVRKHPQFTTRIYKFFVEKNLFTSSAITNLPQHIEGNLDLKLDFICDMSHMPETVSGNLTIETTNVSKYPSFMTLNTRGFKTKVGGCLTVTESSLFPIPDEVEFQHLCLPRNFPHVAVTLPRQIKGNLTHDSFVDIDDLVLPEIIGGDFVLSCNGVKNFKKIPKIGGNLIINTHVKSFDGLSPVLDCGFGFIFFEAYCNQVPDCIENYPTHVAGNFTIHFSEKYNRCSFNPFPKFVGGDMQIDRDPPVEEISSIIEGDLILRRITKCFKISGLVKGNLIFEHTQGSVMEQFIKNLEPGKVNGHFFDSQKYPNQLVKLNYE